MLKTIFPFLVWFQTLNNKTLRADLISGITVALVLIPQSMAYAQLAGLPPYYGLYAAFLPPMVASLFGSSRQLATGPVAVVSLMSAASLEPLATAGSEAFIAYSILLAFIAGTFQFSLGLLRLGVVVNFLAHPVVLGFTNAAAIIIATSQLPKIFGVYVDKGEHHYETIISVVKAAFDYTHWPTLGFAVLAFAIMFILKKKAPKVPNVLVAVAVSILLSWGFGFQNTSKVTVSQVMSSETIEAINDFNSATQEIEDLAQKRARIGNQVIKVQKELGKLSIIVFELNQKIDKINVHMKELKEKAGLFRYTLRAQKFEMVQEDGKQVFFIRGNIPKGKQGDNRIWRLKIGNRVLDKDVLTFSGGGSVVGEIPKGLPKLAFPKLDIAIALKIFPAAIIISLLGFMEAISIAKAMAGRTGQRLDPNQELIGQGLANIVGSIGQSYSVSGSFSRSAVNIQAGAISGLSSVFTSCVVIVTLLFLTPLLYHLPQAVLAAVIMMAVIGLVNVDGIIHTWRAQRYDGITAVVTFVSTLIFAPHLDKGIMVGFMLSIMTHLYQTMKPHVAELSTDSALPTDIIDNTLQDAELYGLNRCKHITIIRFDGSLIFANTSYLEDQVLECLSLKPELNNIVFVADGINTLDATGEAMLASLVGRLREKNINVSFCGLKEQVSDVMKRTSLYGKIGENNMFNTEAQALLALYSDAHLHGEEQDCPLKRLVYYKSFDFAKRSRVLLVDDEKDFTQLLSTRMELRDLETSTAYDGKGALSLIESERPDVVVLDLNMPDIDGMEVLRRVKKDQPRIEIIILTGHGSVEDEKTALELGAFAFLKKPVDINTLVKTVEEAYKKIGGGVCLR